jgi:FtsZ-binding cell division protein ZapB
MANLAEEHQLYTIGHAADILSLDNHTLMAHIHQLNITPKVDEASGTFTLTQKDLELLKQEIKDAPPTRADESRSIRRRPSSDTLRNYASYPGGNSLSGPAPTAANLAAGANALPEKKDNINVIIEAVSQVKEGILRDLSRLLDDKLAGLDEVVVELIRCKSENDALKQKLQAVHDEKEALRQELGRFKHVQFGFYRKV